MAQSNCCICGADAVKPIEGYERLPRVTSDCLPFPAGGALGVCQSCGSVVKRADDSWRAEIAKIYESYEAYRQGDGHEQRVRDPMRGDEIRPRSALLLDRVKSVLPLPEQASALDVGCGSGVMLAALSDALPNWNLDGFDLDDRAALRLRAIPGFRRLFTDDIADIDARYRLITLMHSLEHFDGDLVEPLQRIIALLEPEGGLFVEVPNVDVNLFDILIADHLIHFDHAALGAVAKRAGLSPLIITNDWLGKELSMVAQFGSPTQPVAPWPNPVDPAWRHAQIQARTNWLADSLVLAKHATDRGGSVGVFGTAIAATWIAGALGDAINFFVDDDPNRQGRLHLDLPILAVERIPANATVIVPMEPAPAARICARLQALPQGLTVVSVTQGA